MKLRHYRNLSSTPDFIEITNLEELILEGCVNLVKVHPSIGMLKRLVVLNIRNCTRLRSFPCKVEMNSLEVLNLSGCSKLDKLPKVLGTIKTLMELRVDRTSIKELPSFIFSLSNLRVFSIGRHGGIRSRWGTSTFWPSCLPTKLQHPQSLVLPSLASLRLLRRLDVSYCNISEVSPDIGSLSCLEYLNLSGNNFTTLPASLSQLPRLRDLLLQDCMKLEVMPELPPRVKWFELSSLCYPFILRVLERNILDCTSLHLRHKLRDMPVSFRWYLFLNSFPKLVVNLTIESLVSLLLTSQGLDYLSYPILDIVFQGNFIPRCFTNQNTGNEVRVEFPGGWCYNKFKGYVTCVVLTPIKSCHGKTFVDLPSYFVSNFDGGFLGGETMFWYNKPMVETKRMNGSEVIWFHYSKRKSSWKEAENFVTFSFEGNGVVEVKACGVRLVCDEEDIQEKETRGSSMQGLPTPTQDAGGVVVSSNPNHDWISRSIADEPPFKKTITVWSSD